MTTKTDTVKELVLKNDDGSIKKALRIAKDFRYGMSKEQNDELNLAYECIVHPAFYSSVGVNTDDAIKKGIRTLYSLYR